MDAETNIIPEPSLKDSMQILLMQVPMPVRDFVLNTLPMKTEELMTRYQLHVDQGGTLERELLLMLLGQETPTEFVSALQDMGLDGQTIQSLTNDINKEVFMKLRESEERVGVAPVQVAPTMPQHIVVPVAPPPMPAPRPVAPPPPNLPGMPMPQAHAPAPAPISAPIPFTPPITAPFTASLPNETTEVRTMQTDMAMMKSGMHPGLVPVVSTASTPPPAMPVQRAPMQPPSLNTSSAPVPPPIPVSIPAPTSHPVMPPAPPPMPPAPNTSAPQSDNREALHAILKEYGVDPYREPVN